MFWLAIPPWVPHNSRLGLAGFFWRFWSLSSFPPIFPRVFLSGCSVLLHQHSPSLKSTQSSSAEIYYHFTSTSSMVGTFISRSSKTFPPFPLLPILLSPASLAIQLSLPPHSSFSPLLYLPCNDTETMMRWRCMKSEDAGMGDIT